MASVFKNLFISMRPKQWLKNLFVFAAIIFVREFTNTEKVVLTIWAFVLFSLASSAIYLVNDLVDLKKDRLHPVKKFRPLAAGQLSPWLAGTAAILLGGVAIAGGFYLNYLFGLTISAYVLLNLLYSFVLKNLIVIDVFTIAVGFVLRVAAGAAVILVPVSIWIILSTFFFTLFLAVNKRRTELAVSADGGTRSVLKYYSPALLNQMNIVSLSATIITYTFYTFSSEHSRLLMLTVPIVLYGLFYYLHVLDRTPQKESGPTEVFLREKNLQLTVLVWVIIAVLILLLS